MDLNEEDLLVVLDEQEAISDDLTLVLKARDRVEALLMEPSQSALVELTRVVERMLQRELQRSVS